MDVRADAVTVVTDTLAYKDGRPAAFVAKSFPLPHLESVIALTGVAELGWLWWQKLQLIGLALDVDTLDEITPPALRELQHGLLCMHGDGLDTSTVYHVGWSYAQSRYLLYAYRSTNDFESELLNVDAPESHLVKPSPVSAFEWPTDQVALVTLAEQVRDDELALPPEDRVNIGGDLVVTHCSLGSMTSGRIHRFSNFYEQWEEMVEAYHRSR